MFCPAPLLLKLMENHPPTLLSSEPSLLNFRVIFCLHHHSTQRQCIQGSVPEGQEMHTVKRQKLQMWAWSEHCRNCRNDLVSMPLHWFEELIWINQVNILDFFYTVNINVTKQMSMQKHFSSVVVYHTPSPCIAWPALARLQQREQNLWQLRCVNEKIVFPCLALCSKLFLHNGFELKSWAAKYQPVGRTKSSGNSALLDHL